MTLPVYVNGKFCAQRTTGVQRVAREMLHAVDPLVERGRWTLLCPPDAEPPRLSNVAVEVLGPAGLPLHLWEQAVLPRRARDGLLVNLSGSAPAFARRQVATLHDAAVFDHPEAYRPVFRAWYRWLFRRLARTAVGLHTVSAFSRGRLIARLGTAAERCVVVPNGGDHLLNSAADPSAIDRLGLRGRRFLLAVGSHNPTKGLDLLMQAVASLPHDAPLVVVAGPVNDRVFSSATPLAGTGVLAIGPVGDAALIALYREALALVFPSTYEGFGLPPLEAMSLGCPVVTAANAAIPEVCGDAVLYAEDGSAAALASAMTQVASQPALRASLRDRGLTRVESRSWHQSAVRLLCALGDLGDAPR